MSCDEDANEAPWARWVVGGVAAGGLFGGISFAALATGAAGRPCSFGGRVLFFLLSCRIGLKGM